MMNKTFDCDRGRGDYDDKSHNDYRNLQCKQFYNNHTRNSKMKSNMRFPKMSNSKIVTLNMDGIPYKVIINDSVIPVEFVPTKKTGKWKSNTAFTCKQTNTSSSRRGV